VPAGLSGEPELVPVPKPLPELPVPRLLPELVPVPKPDPLLVPLPVADEPLREERRLLLDCGREPVSLAPLPVVPVDPLPVVPLPVVPVPERSLVFP